MYAHTASTVGVSFMVASLRQFTTTCLVTCQVGWRRLTRAAATGSSCTSRARRAASNVRGEAPGIPARSCMAAWRRCQPPTFGQGRAPREPSRAASTPRDWQRLVRCASRSGRAWLHEAWAIGCGLAHRALAPRLGLGSTFAAAAPRHANPMPLSWHDSCRLGWHGSCYPGEPPDQGSRGWSPPSQSAHKFLRVPGN